MPSLRASLLGFGVAALAGASCSLINSFDPVKESTGSAGHASTSSSGGGGAGTGGASATSSTGTGGSPAGGGGTGGTGGSAPKGLIVATGTLGSNRVFATLDPTDGHQLKSYTMNAVAVIYDEDTDLWYVFEGKAIPPVPGAMTLHAGRIDPGTGVWTDLHQLPNIPITADIQSFAVLNHRIVYKAYDPDSDAGFSAPLGLAIIDTTKPAPVLGGARGWVSVPDFFGLIGTRANTIDGGVVNLISLEPCVGAVCQLDRTRVSFGTDPGQDPGVSFASHAVGVPVAPNPSSISAAWTSKTKDSAADVIAFPPIAGTSATVQTFNPLSTQMVTDVGFAASGSNQFYAAAIAECEGVVVLSEQANQAIYAVSLANQTATSAGTSSPAQILAYEPITHTVVVPLHIPNVPIAGYTLGMSGTTPTLAQRQWSTPANLNADNVTTRRLKQPTTASCAQ